MSSLSHAAAESDFDGPGCAAEEVALRLGWLRECPYHGEPFRPGFASPELPARSFEIEALPPFMSREELLSLALELLKGYSDECASCARERALPQ